MSLGRKVLSSAFLLFARKIWGNVINLVVMAFLARLLSKEDFGLLAISSFLLSIINTLATSGIAEYVIYYNGDNYREKTNAAFWLNFILTLAVLCVVVVAGPAWAGYYGNVKIYPLLLVLMVSFFFEMNATIPKAVLRKELDYRTIVFYSSIGMTIVSIGKLACAWSGFGVYSLAAPQAVVSPLLMTAFFIKSRWRPFVEMGFSHFKDIYRFTRHIIGGRVLTKLVNEGDNLIVGKLVGLEGLGIYALAFQLANLVTTNVVTLVNELFLPLFSKVRDDFERLKDYFRRMIKLLSFVSFPLICVLVICAQPIVELIYGQKWTDAVVPLQILAFFALGRSLSSPSSSLFAALGRPDIGFKFTLIFTPIFLLSVYVGSAYGIIGVALATTITRISGSITSLYLSLRLLELSLIDLYRVIRSNLASMIFVLVCSSYFVLFGWPKGSELLVVVIAPAVVYIYILFQRVFFSNVLIGFILELEKHISFSRLTILFQRCVFLRIER